MEMPPQPANHGTGNGLLGVLPASSVPPSPTAQAMAYADPAPRAQPLPQLAHLHEEAAVRPPLSSLLDLARAGRVVERIEAGLLDHAG